MTRKALLLVHSNAVEGQTDDFNTWYDQVHIPQMLERVPGVVRASRYEASPDRRPLPERYLAIYEIEADDPAAVVKAINKAAAGGELDMSPAMDVSKPPVMALYEPLGGQ